MWWENERDHEHKANHMELMNLKRIKKNKIFFWKNKWFVFLPLTDSFVGDAVVNLIPLGLIYSLLFDGICFSWIVVDIWFVWSIFDDESSNDGIINGIIVWGDVSIVKLDSFSVVSVNKIAFVALSIAVGWLSSDD